MRTQTKSYTSLSTYRDSNGRSQKSSVSHRNLAFAYYRLSREEAQNGESASISNQKKIVEAYCEHNNIALLDFFVDDGWSGGNFAGVR